MWWTWIRYGGASPNRVKTYNASNGRSRCRASKNGKSFACWRATRRIGTRFGPRCSRSTVAIMTCCARSWRNAAHLARSTSASEVAGEREDRRAARGFIAPADARAFLELARRGDQLEARDTITMAYFRARASEKRVWSAEDAPHERGRSPAAVSKLVRLL